MDAVDFEILEVLKINGRATVSEISKRVNLSLPAVAERIKKMEDSGLIEQYTVRINREKLNQKLLAFVLVNIEKAEYIQGFREAIIQFNSVLECHHVAGEYDYLLKVLVESPNALEEFLTNGLKKIKGVVKSNTIISLLTIKEIINK
ncbi:MAG: Lrp/AsnC family transcriptional regulator [Chloroflexi bacterium]|nr:Lrp/AsnC family transcriptional regulator [Chloroflexota bacterium]